MVSPSARFIASIFSRSTLIPRIFAFFVFEFSIRVLKMLPIFLINRLLGQLNEKVFSLVGINMTSALRLRPFGPKINCSASSPYLAVKCSVNLIRFATANLFFFLIV